jgi:hypothetical protein
LGGDLPFPGIFIVQLLLLLYASHLKLRNLL